jgi:hypothetical protein
MPANLDVATRRIVVFVSSFTTLAIAIPALYAQFVMIPNFRRKLSSSGITMEASNPSLFAGCLLSVALMVAVTIVATLPIIASDNEHHRLQQQQFLSSSINFCEEDFQSSPYIAEPANTMSSLTCYVPLALFGLMSTRHGQRAKRFVVIYSTLLAIGLGSMALHALLTAQAQGGDELPMLWFTAAVAFCALDVIFHRYNKTMWLAVLVAGSAVIATATYIGGRHDFTIFYILFSVYCQTMVFSIIYITLGIDWESISLHEGLHFKAAVLYPLAIATGWSTVLAVWIWVSEMLYCNAVMQDGAFGVVVAPFVWNRVVHPMWHFWSGMLAFLLIQVLVAAHGVQRGWGTPAIQWFGAPFVVFRQDLSQTKSQ